MAKSNEVVTEVADAPVVVADVPQELTLHEFCLRLSSVDKRPELIGGFHYSETAAGTIKATEADFKARFAVFANKPA